MAQGPKPIFEVVLVFGQQLTSEISNIQQQDLFPTPKGMSLSYVNQLRRLTSIFSLIVPIPQFGGCHKPKKPLQITESFKFYSDTVQLTSKYVVGDKVSSLPTDDIVVCISGVYNKIINCRMSTV